MYGPKWPFLLKYGSRDTRHIDFSRVDGLSTDIPDLGRHKKQPSHRDVGSPSLNIGMHSCRNVAKTSSQKQQSYVMT